MNDVKTKRAYRSPLRQAQAESTRIAILEAGLGLFEARGYGSATIAAIAREAGVSAETIYATFGSKGAILEALVGQALGEGVAQRALAEWSDRAGRPRDQLAILAGVAAGFWSEHRALVTVLRQGTGEAELRGAWDARQRDRRRLMGALVGSWPAALLRPDLTSETAADLTWTLTSAEVFDLLTGAMGWSVEAYREQLTAMLARTLLADPG